MVIEACILQKNTRRVEAPLRLSFPLRRRVPAEEGVSGSGDVVDVHHLYRPLLLGFRRRRRREGKPERQLRRLAPKVIGRKKESWWETEGEGGERRRYRSGPPGSSRGASSSPRPAFLRRPSSPSAPSAQRRGGEEGRVSHSLYRQTWPSSSLRFSRDLQLDEAG